MDSLENSSQCKRKGQFKPDEYHKCFKLGCNMPVAPAIMSTCSKCNFKRCQAGHCACHLTEEARHAVKILYETYCEFCKDVSSN